MRLDDDDLDVVLSDARLDRLGGLLAGAVDAGQVVASTSATAAVHDLWRESMVSSVLAEAGALRAAAVLEDAGVVWRLTKGPALAHLDYADPNMRPFGDADILVHPAGWRDALLALGAAGWHRTAPELSVGFDDRYGKGATLLDPSGGELDVHRRLAIGRFGIRLPTESLFVDGADHLTIGGRRLPVMHRVGRLVHAAFHAALGGFRLIRAHRDVVQMVLVAEVDWSAARDLMAAYRVDAVLARAVTDAWTQLHLERTHPCVRWADAFEIGRLDRHALRVFAEDRPWADQALTALPCLIGRGAARYVFTLWRQPGARTPPTEVTG